MISISAINYKPIFKGESQNVDNINNGDKALNENKPQEALKYYQAANKENPSDYSIYRKLGKADFQLKNYKEAEKNFNIYLKNNPDDADCLIELGNSQSMQGLHKKAFESYKKAYNLDNTNDLAKRSMLSAQNMMLSMYAPQKAQQEKAQQAEKNLKEALDLTVKYMGLKDVSVQFGKTDSMGGASNIAQYENSKNTITVSDSYIYASAQVIAAYLVHESIHAHDKDAYTSVREEQDAYEKSVKFWSKNSKKVKDPEMDYALGLYKKSPLELRDRVKEIYMLRDPDIAQTSPNHPPKQHFNYNASKSKAASQSIQEYNVIA